MDSDSYGAHSETVIETSDLGKSFLIGSKAEKESFLNATHRLLMGTGSQRTLWALRHINLEVRRGDMLGIIGPDGAGKSTLLLLLAGILASSEGSVSVLGKTNQLFRLEEGLRPTLTVRENLSLCAALLGMSQREFADLMPSILSFSGLEDYLFAKCGELSTGLAARVYFSVAIHADRDIILVDEKLAVCDNAFQSKCLAAFRDLHKRGTILIVSHNLRLIERLCPRTLYLNGGRAAFLGETAEAVRLFVRDCGGGPWDTQPAAGPTKRLAAVPAAAIPDADEIMGCMRDSLRAGLRRELEPFVAEVRAIDQMASRLRERQSEVGQPSMTAILRRLRRPTMKEVVEAWRTALGHDGALQVVSASFENMMNLMFTHLMSQSSPYRLHEGDEVITTAATALSSSYLLPFGLVPVLVDVDPATYNLDPAQLDKALSPRTRAVLTSSGAGSAPPWERLRAFCDEHGLLLLEGAFEYLGCRYDGKAAGTWGDIGYCRPMLEALPGTWGLLLARPKFNELFSQPVPAVQKPPSSRMTTLGLTLALEACGELGETLSRQKAAIAELRASFCAYPDHFQLPELPAQFSADPAHMTVIVRDGAGFSAKELGTALGTKWAAPYRINRLDDQYIRCFCGREGRRVGDLPHTNELLQRGFNIFLGSFPPGELRKALAQFMQTLESRTRRKGFRRPGAAVSRRVG